MPGLKNWSSATRNSEPAQAIVEFALVAPIFFFVLLGIFEVGRLMIEYSSIANAAREGARLGSIEANSISYIQSESRRFSIVTGPTPDVTVVVQRAGTPIPIATPRKSTDRIEVTVSHTFQPLGFLTNPSVPLSATSRMQVE